MRHRNPVLALAFLGTCAASLSAPAQEPLENAHAHNDYLHEHPLFDALDRGFTSVEADIFLVDGKLLVGHDRSELKPDRTLESLYLAPLARRVRKNGGRVYQNGLRFFLLIDIKSDAQATYRHLEKVLSEHADILTSVGDDGEVRQAAVTAVISGARPRDEVIKASPRYAGLDGRIADLDSNAPAHVMPMISDKWTDHFSWNGHRPMPAAERVKLKEIVSKAHAADRVVRFWATPENEHVWTELRSSGVDLINTDQLDRLATFLRAVEDK
jgi:hypothetical protein